jgi:hypothetical protein
MINSSELNLFVEKNITDFHNRRIEGLIHLKLRNVLKRKNPYLFKAKYLHTAQDIVKALMDAHLSSQEETHFGEFLEKLAIYVNSIIFAGYKSAVPGIDLEFENSGIRYIVAIKSGPNWGNSSQIAKMRDDFRKASITLRTSGSILNIIAVNGCCYGNVKNCDKGDYFKYCGQMFWSFISGDDDFYLNIIEPIGYKAKEKNDEFLKQYYLILNKFSNEFYKDFCLPSGAIDWGKITRYNSQII